MNLRTLLLLPHLPLLLLLLLLLISDFLPSAESADTPTNSTGKKFIITFPENIAYFFPSQPSNKIQVIAVTNNTEVRVTAHLEQEQNVTMRAGQIEEFVFDDLELGKETISNKTIQITSTKDIAVNAISMKNSSLQTALIMPTDKLGTKYIIPANRQPTFNQSVTEKSAFRLVILNTEEENKVTVKGQSDKEISLSPHQVAQVWLDENWKTIEASSPVAVFFGHPCLVSRCSCGLMYTALQPTSDTPLKFFIPSFVTGDNLTFVLLPDSQTEPMIPYKPASPVAESAGTAIIFLGGVGLLLTLIPETNFASCYAVSSIPDMSTYVVIVVHKDQQDGVSVGKTAVSQWTSLGGTDYVSAKINLVEEKNIIWHAKSKMAVYFMGEKDGRMFGNPAPIISTNPDFRGCVLTSEELHIGDTLLGWRESVTYCRDMKMGLVCPSNEVHREQIYKQLARMNRFMEMWIGMRRSSLTGEWYWINDNPVQSQDWGDGEPGTMEEGQCTMLVMNAQDPFWRDADCCKKAYPLCIKSGTFLPLEPVV